MPSCTDAAAWFLQGNGLPGRWQGRERFVVLLTDDARGEAFLALWRAWLADPARPASLVVMSIVARGLQPGGAPPDEQTGTTRRPSDPLAQALHRQWPVDTPDLHTLSFEQGRVKLLLALGETSRWMPELVAEVDAFCLNAARSTRAEAGSARWYRQCARLAHDDATVAGFDTDAAHRDQTRAALSAAGFLLSPPTDPGDPAAGPVAGFQARLRPANLAARAAWRPPGRRAAPACRTALVVGAGLAGASVAAALAQQGVAVTVLERCAAPAAQTSGNAGGLFHAVVHPHDGLHARLLRAGALYTARLVRPLIASGQLVGDCSGLLRGAHTEGQAAPLSGMAAQLQQQALPPDFAQALDSTEASARAGMALADPAWYFAQGGWLNPASLVKHELAHAGICLRLSQAVHRVTALARGGWLAQDGDGQTLGTGDVLVLAGAQDGLALLRGHADPDDWPLLRSRGQITEVAETLLGPLALPSPRLPVASGGYGLRLPAEMGGSLLCGASNQPDDEDPTLRAADHLRNLAQLDALSGRACSADALQRRTDAAPSLAGRVGWRLACDDRLPLMGPVPVPWGQLPTLRGLEQARQIPRVPGLYVLSALGSRGITLAPLLGEAMAAWITGAPSPLEASLLDAVDPARFTTRRVRRGS